MKLSTCLFFIVVISSKGAIANTPSEVCKGKEETLKMLVEELKETEGSNRYSIYYDIEEIKKSCMS